MKAIHRSMVPAILAAAAILLGGMIGACTHKSATAPTPPVENHSPVIASMMAFPDYLGPQDSTLVVCMASDPDGDTLVYDWTTDSRFIIKGNVPSDHHLYDSPYNYQVFYRNYVSSTDTAWIQCIARDQKGGAVGRVLVVHVHS